MLLGVIEGGERGGWRGLRSDDNFPGLAHLDLHPASNSSSVSILQLGLLTWLSLCCRLYSKGRILGHKRAKRNTRPNTTLVQIEGVATKEDAQFYLGKVHITATTGKHFHTHTVPAYCIRLPGEEEDRGFQCPRYLGVRTVFISATHLLIALYRRVTRSHGNSGVVKSKFRSNIPPHAFGASVRVVRSLLCSQSTRNLTYHD